MVILRAILLLLVAETAHAGFFSRIFSVEEERSQVVKLHQGVPISLLQNASQIPLVGFGVGGLPDTKIPALVAEAMQDDKRTRLFDTAHVHGNEALVTMGILKGVERLQPQEPVEVHIVAKVWYTHLGYERTKLAVDEIAARFQPLVDAPMIDLRLHLMLHWPKCYKSIEWMKCDQEESKLVDSVKQAGPDPNKNHLAYLDSWRLLEDYYLDQPVPIETIGVANFHLEDLETIQVSARILPSIMQVNLWSILYDSKIMEYAHRHNIHVQAFHVLRHTLASPENAPRAFHFLQKIAGDIESTTGVTTTPSQVLLAWLIQHGISVIPRTSSGDRLLLNSAAALTFLPALSDDQVEVVAHATEAYLSGQDLAQDVHVRVTFHAPHHDVFVAWLGPDQEEVIITSIHAGASFNETTYPGHRYRLYDATNRDNFVDCQVSANYGYHEHVDVNLDEKGHPSVASRTELERETAGFSRMPGILREKQ